MSDTGSGPDLLNDLANDFAERYRCGERPDLAEYAAKYPELAAEIRELFPALAVIEEFGSAAAGPASWHSRTATPAGAPPRQLGEYRILREVARGGMGIVYEAVQESLGRHVALKVLPFPSLADACRLERFRREARAAAMLHHSNIVPIFGVGEHEGVHYFAMQFIRGQALDCVLHELRGQGRAEADALGAFAEEPAPAGGRTGDPELAVTLAGAMMTGQFAADSGARRDRDAHEVVRIAPDIPAGPGPGRPGGATTEVLGAGSEWPSKPDAPRPDAATSRSAFGAGSEWPSKWDRPYFRSVARVGLQVAEALAYAHHQGVLHRDIKPANILLDTEGTAWVTDFGLAKADGTDDLTGPGDLVGTLRYMAPERFRGQADPRSDVVSLGLTLYEMATLRPAFAAPERAQLIARMLHDEPPRPRAIDRRIPRDLETLILTAIAKEPARRYQTAGELAADLERFLADRPIRARRSRWPERLWRWCRRNPAVTALTSSVALLVLAVAVISTSAAFGLARSRSTALHLLGRARDAEARLTDQLRQSLLVRARAGPFSHLSGRRFDSLDAVAQAARLRPAPDLRDAAIACLALVDLKLERHVDYPRDESPSGFDPRFERYAVGDRRGGVVIRRADDDREILRLPGSDGAVEWVEFNTRGTRLGVQYAGANEVPVVRVWDLTRGARPGSVILAGATTCPVFRPDDRPALARLRDGGFGLFDVTSGRLVRKMDLAFRAKGWRISADGRRLAVSGEADRTVHVLDVERGEEVGSYPTESTVSSLAWRADGKLLAGGGSDGLIRVWDDEARRRLSVLEGHRHGVVSLAFTHSGGLLVTTADDGTTRVWEPVGGRLLVAANSAGRHLQVSADDRYVAHDTYGWGPTVLRLDTARECRVLLHGLAGNRTPRPSQAGPADVDFSPDGRWLASAGMDGVRLWDAARGQEVAHLPVNRCVTARFRQDGTGLLTLGDTGLELWSISSLDPGAAGGVRVGPSQSRLPDCGQGVIKGDKPGNFASSRDGRLLAFGTPEGVHLVEPDTDRRLAVLAPPPDAPTGIARLAFSPDASQLAVSVGDSTILLWDLRLVRERLAALGLD